MTKGFNYTVQKGDTIQGLAKMYLGSDDKWTKIVELNPDLSNIYTKKTKASSGTEYIPLTDFLNKELILPAGSTLNSYKIMEGDRLVDIAKEFVGNQNKWQDIINANNDLKALYEYNDNQINLLKVGNIISPGQEIFIPLAGDDANV